MNKSFLKRSASGPDNAQDPAAAVAAIEALSARHSTPCGDGHIVWRRWGRGQPVVLIHGGAGSWSHWIRNVEALSERHAVWALDMPGFGESSVPEQLSAEAISEAVEQGLRMLFAGDELVNVVGFSFGAAIATMISARLKGRLSNLVLLGARFVRYSKRDNLRLVAWKKIADPAERLAAHRNNLEMMMIADPGNVDALAVYLQSINTKRARIYGGKWKPSPIDKLHEYFPQVRARERITVVFGRGDKGAQSIIETRGSALQTVHPNLDFRIIENAGHWVQYEAAGEVNTILLDALSASAHEV